MSATNTISRSDVANMLRDTLRDTFSGNDVLALAVAIGPVNKAFRKRTAKANATRERAYNLLQQLNTERKQP